MQSLFPYQLEAISWLCERSKALLALEMGLGKTAIAIRAATTCRYQRVLVLCPAVACINWEREFEEWSDKRFPHKITISSYSSLHKIPEDQIWDLAILDESHYLKSTTTARTRAVLGKTGVLRRVKHAIWALSGTPAPNHAGELWPLLHAFGVTKLTYSQWCKAFCEQKVFSLYQKGRKIEVRQITGTKIAHIPHLKQVLAPIMLRKRKEDVLKELPPISYQMLTVPPGKVDLEIEPSFAHYAFPLDRSEELFKELELQKNMLKIFVERLDIHPQTKHAGPDGLSSIYDSVATLRRYIGLQKVEAVASLLEDELVSWAYEKVVVFAIHQGVVEGLRNRLAKFGVVTLYGGTPIDKRQRHIDKFQTNPRCRVFVANIHSAGTAITLTVAHQVVFIEQDWVPGNNAQAAMRCHRIGQTKPVNVRVVALAGSLDERIAQVLRKKMQELTQIFDA